VRVDIPTITLCQRRHCENQHICAVYGPIPKGNDFDQPLYPTIVIRAALRSPQAVVLCPQEPCGA
jgi:hypothetical protein